RGPETPGFGIGTTADGIRCVRSEASWLIRHPALYQCNNDREPRDVRSDGVCRNPSCDGDAIPYRDRLPSSLHVSDPYLKGRPPHAAPKIFLCPPARPPPSAPGFHQPPLPPAPPQHLCRPGRHIAAPGDDLIGADEGEVGAMKRREFLWIL